MTFIFTQSQAKALHDAKCSVRSTFCTGGVHAQGRYCAELIFDPTGAVIHEEYHEKEDVANTAVIGHINKAPSASGSPAQAMIDENARLAAEVAALKKQLESAPASSGSKPDEFDSLKAPEPADAEKKRRGPRRLEIVEPAPVQN